MKQIDLREGARRQHRPIALFAVLQCWLDGLDGVVFQRHQLERLLGLERFRSTRVDWMQEDFKEFFPYSETYYSVKQGRPFAALFVSRISLRPLIPKGPMASEQRITLLKENGGPSLDFFKMWEHPKPADVQEQFEGSIPFFADFANYDERLLSSYLTLLAQGQIALKNIPPLKKEVAQDG